MVEVGYAVVPVQRRRGCVRAGLEALLQRAANEPEVFTVRASIGPGSSASCNVVVRHGFTEGEWQWDDEDGIEIICAVAPGLSGVQ